MSNHIPAAVKNLMLQVSQQMTYRSVTAVRVGLEVTQNFVDVVVNGTIRTFTDKDLGGLVQQGDRKVYIAGLDLATVNPKPNDKIVVDGKEYNIYAINEREASGEDAIFIMNVRG